MELRLFLVVVFICLEQFYIQFKLVGRDEKIFTTGQVWSLTELWLGSVRIAGEYFLIPGDRQPTKD